MVRGVSPVCHSNLKTYRTDYRERCRKTIPRKVDPVLDEIDSSTKGFAEILSKVLVAREKSLSFTYGRPEESCSSFILMYFGKARPNGRVVKSVLVQIILIPQNFHTPHQLFYCVDTVSDQGREHRVRGSAYCACAEVILTFTMNGVSNLFYHCLST